MKVTKIRVGGVPEHFNIPWHTAMGSGRFYSNDIELNWKDYPGGTGAMCSDLNSGKLDVAIVLSEGAVADIIKNQKNEILQYYVKSPLTWGIHTGKENFGKNIDALSGSKYAISRFGSGSHLMAYVDAEQRGWTLQEDQFNVVDNLDGAVSSLSENESQLFFWEKFTTKPYVEKGIFERVSECKTPWPCFMIIARKSFVANNEDAVRRLMDTINESCAFCSELSDIIQLISEKYQLKTADVKEWYKELEWSSDCKIRKSSLDTIMETLLRLKLITKKVSPESLCSRFTDLI